MRRLPSIVAFVLVAILAPQFAAAQNWPVRPVRVVVPFAAGGNTDTMARLFADHLQRALGQPFLVENRVGAGGAIASEHVARSAPDGYTLYFASTGQIVIQPHVQKLSFDALRDFVPIVPFGVNPFVLGVSSRVPIKDLRGFVEHARARPGQLNYASGGNGSVGHLTGAMFLSRAGITLAHVPYKGAAPAAAALAAGEIEMYFGNFSDVVPQAKSGRVLLLGVSSEKRDPQLPEIPAIAEVYPGFSSTTWNGLLAPAGTPREIVDRIARECPRATAEPVIRERLSVMGVTPACVSPEAFTRAIAAEFAAYRDAARAAGLQPE